MGISSPAIRRLSTTRRPPWLLAAACALIAALGVAVAIQLRPAPASTTAAVELSATPEARLAPVSETGAHSRSQTLPAAAASAVSSRLGRDLPAFGFHTTAAGSFTANTPSQRLSSRFGAAGAQIRTGGAQLRLTVTRLDQREISANVAPRLTGHRVVYGYPGARAWYANGPLGVEQGFTVSTPARQTTLRLATSGLRPQLTPTGVRFGTQLRYVDLRAEDADGHPLHAWLSLAHRTVVIHVNSAGARFPITIDPLVQEATLEPTDPAGIQGFGYSVAIAGDLLVVGEPDGIGVGAGGDSAAYVFQQGQTGWSDATQVAALTSAENGSDFGETVAISPDGEVIAVGAPDGAVGDNNSDSGVVYLYDEPGTPSGSATGWVSATESSSYAVSTANELFGASLSLTNNFLLVGAPGADSNAGEAFLYSEPAGGWVDTTKPLDFPGTGTEALGTAVALSPDGSTMVLGAPDASSSNDDEQDVGAAQVLTEPADGWASGTEATEVLTPSDINVGSNGGSGGGDDFGTSIAISADDSTVAVGVPGQNEDAGASPAQGAIDVFVKPSGGWVDATQTAELYDGDYSAAPAEALGENVSFAGASVIAGVTNYNKDNGALYEFEPPTGGWSAEPQDADDGPTLVGTPENDLRPTSVAADGDSVLVGDDEAGPSTSGESEQGGAAVYGYTGPAATTTTTTTMSTTSTVASTTSTVASTTSATVSSSTTTTTVAMATPTQPSAPTATPPTRAPAGFSISPNVEPVLSGQQLTFTANGPEINDFDYHWDFGDTTADDDGFSVSHAFTNPGVYEITLDEIVNGQTIGTAKHSVIVVKAQPPDANLTVLRTNQLGLTPNKPGTGSATAVNDPVTLVPQALLPQVDATAQDSITKIEYFFNAADAQDVPRCSGGPSTCVEVPTGTPDLVCLPNGACGSEAPAHEPVANGLVGVPGVTVLGDKPVYPDGSTTEPISCTRSGLPGFPVVTGPSCQGTSPTNGFSAIQVNFLDAALAQIGDGTNSWASTPEINVAAQHEDVQIGPGTGASGTFARPTETVAYPPFDQLSLHLADGYMGEQGVPDSSCFPGDDFLFSSCFNGADYAAGPAQPAAEPGPDADDAANSSYFPNPEPGLLSVIFGPYDLAHYGINSSQQLEDQWNELYNYATVMGVDTPIDDPFGPATGATQGAKGTIVPRSVTMVAYNAEGLPSAAATEQVPLTPAANPSFSVCVKDVTGSTPCVTAPKKGPLPFTIDTGDELEFQVTGSGGGSAPITKYAIAVGQPNTSVIHGTAIGTTDQCGSESGIGSWFGSRSASSGGSVSVTPSSDSDSPGNEGAGSTPITHGLTKQNAPVTGPMRRADGDLRHADGLTTGGLTIPPFSDLQAGAFPSHDCEGYSDRTVNTYAYAGPSPKSGPTVLLHSNQRTGSAVSARRTAAFTPSASDYYPSLSAATTPTVTLPAPTVATGDPRGTSQAPILITSNPDKLDFSFAHTGTYSASIAAYNSAGLGAITRVDGFLVQKASTPGFCQSVEHQSIDIPGHGDDGFSGNCLTVVGAPIANTHNPTRYHDDLYVSSQPIDVNGVPVAPAPGDSIVINLDQDAFYVTKCQITEAQLTEQPGPDLCPEPKRLSQAGALFLALGSSTIKGQTQPGFAEVPYLNTAEFDVFFAPLGGKGGLPPVGATPTKADINVTSCGLYPDSVAWLNAPHATYDGFAIASTPGPCVGFAKSHGSARVGFWDSLPVGFSNGASAKPDSSQVVLYGSDMPAVSDIGYHPYANVALRRALPPVRIAGDFPKLPSQIETQTQAQRLAGGPTQVRTDDDLPGYPDIPTCPASSNGKSGLSIPDNTSIGSLSLAGASFCYEADTGDFIGNVMVTLPDPLVAKVEAGFEIGHGRLIDAGGEFDGIIPIFAGVDLNAFKFDVKTDPAEVDSEITASIAQLLTIEGGAMISTDPTNVNFSGAVGIYGTGFNFANFSVDITANGSIHLAVAFNEDFGPASLDVSIKGAVDPTTRNFYLEGQGSACLFVCLGVQGLVSNDGVAACGSIDLGFTSISGGFAWLWAGSHTGFHSFSGCDLQPYVPPEFQNDTGAIRRGPLARAPGKQAPNPTVFLQQPTVGPGQSSAPLTLAVPGMCPPPSAGQTAGARAAERVSLRCTDQTVAVQVHSLYDPSDPGATPLVSLTNPAGDYRAPATPSTVLYFGSDSSIGNSTQTTDGAEAQTDELDSLVDQNPVPTDDDVSDSVAYCPETAATTAVTLPTGCQKVTTTTIFIPDPGPGDWRVNVLPGSERVVDISVADEMPQLTPQELGDTVSKVQVSGSGNTYHFKIDGRSYASSLITSHQLLLGSSMLKPAARTTALVKLAAHPTPADLDVAPINTSLLRAVMLKLPRKFPGQMAILDQGTGCSDCTQVIAGDLTDNSIPKAGVPLVFTPITMPAGTPDNDGGTQTLQAFITNSEGMPSRVINLVTFKTPAIPKPAAPVITNVVRGHGSVVHLFVNIMNTPPTGSLALALHSGSGAQYDESFAFDNGSIVPVASSPMVGVGAASHHEIWEITVPDVDPTTPIHVALAGLNSGVLGASSAQHMFKADVPSLSHAGVVAKLAFGSATGTSETKSPSFTRKERLR